METRKLLAILSLVLAAVLYLGFVAGLFGAAVAPLDVGLVSTTAVFLFLGLVGLWLAKVTPARS